MKYFGEGLSERHKELSTVIRKADRLEEARQKFFDLHGQLHRSAVSGGVRNEVDLLLDDLLPEEYRIMPTQKDETIAWVLWHVARIEDLTMNFLVAGSAQIFDNKWKKRLNVSITDTGNALTDDEILELSGQLDIDSLLAYRDAVGTQTREIVGALAAGEMKRKVSPQGIEAIRQAGGVTEQEESAWLLEYWGKKDVAGILLMPPTRHLIMHFNDCCKWKQGMRKPK